MKRENRKRLCVGVCLLAAFALWTAAVRVVDVRPIGPQGSSVGFAAVNGFVHRLTSVNMALYTVTDWLGLVPIGVAAGFGLLGLGQWISRKSLFGVDRSLLALGGFYLAVMAAFVFFEMYVVNYRPVCIEGRLEASYPSSTTMLVMCVMPTAAMQLNARIKSGALRRCAVLAAYAFMAFMVIGRLISGVHWLTDIIGGALLSAGLVAVYASIGGQEQQIRK